MQTKMKSATPLLLVLGALSYLVDESSTSHLVDTALPAKVSQLVQHCVGVDKTTFPAGRVMFIIQLLMPVSLGESHARNKRQSLSMTQPFRVLPVYDANVDTK